MELDYGIISTINHLFLYYSVQNGFDKLLSNPTCKPQDDLGILMANFKHILNGLSFLYKSNKFSVLTTHSSNGEKLYYIGGETIGMCFSTVTRTTSTQRNIEMCWMNELPCQMGQNT